MQVFHEFSIVYNGGLRHSAKADFFLYSRRMPSVRHVPRDQGAIFSGVPAASLPTRRIADIMPSAWSIRVALWREG